MAVGLCGGCCGGEGKRTTEGAIWWISCFKGIGGNVVAVGIILWGQGCGKGGKAWYCGKKGISGGCLWDWYVGIKAVGCGGIWVWIWKGFGFNVWMNVVDAKICWFASCGVWCMGWLICRYWYLLFWI